MIRFFLGFCLIFFISCAGNQSDKKTSKVNDIPISRSGYLEEKSTNSEDETKQFKENSGAGGSGKKYTLIRLSHHVNTASNEYLPCYDAKNKQLFFTGMDRSGFFNHKIDFTQTRESGGEDVFVAKMQKGLFDDAVPVQNLNTNAHEAVNQVMNDGSLLLSGNYQENLGPGNDQNGSATEDLFQAIKTTDGYRLYHFEEPVNSIYTDLDGYMSEKKDFILFSSDRPKGTGEYHKKGWMWNSNYWGNTDIYVAFSENGNWTQAINLGNKVNTPFAERTPFLSADGLTLYISSNGYKKGLNDMDIYFFKRTDTNNWTEWIGPFPCKGLNTDGDEWGFRDYGDIAFFSRSAPLKFVPTAKARNGTGFVFENNYRSGYVVTGAQSGSFSAKEQTDIFMALNTDKPSFSLPDALFEVDRSEIRKADLAAFSEKLLDLIQMNAPARIIIEGHTDDRGTAAHNIKLSLSRAESVKNIIVASGYPEKNISITGLGSSRPVAGNDTPEGRQKNRRVEVSLLNKQE